MENFKLASKLKLRFAINLAVLGEQFKNKYATGEVSTEELWDYPIPILDRLALQLEQDYKASGQKSFIKKKSPKNKTLQLKFNVVLAILEAKVEDAAAINETQANKAHNEKIERIIAKKTDAALEDMNVEDLRKLLK